MSEQFVQREQGEDQQEKRQRFMDMNPGALEAYINDIQERIAGIQSDKEDIDGTQIPHFTQVLDSLTAESRSLGVEMVNEQNEYKVAVDVLTVKKERIRESLERKERRAAVERARMMTSSIQKVALSEQLTETTQAPVRPETPVIKPVQAAARPVVAPEITRYASEPEVDADDESIYTPTPRKTPKVKKDKTAAAKKINLNELAGSTSVGWRERMTSYRPGKKTIGSVAVLGVLTTGGFLVSGMGDGENVAQNVSFGQGFNEEGVSKTAEDVADIDFTVDVGVYMGEDEKGPIMAKIPFEWNDDETERHVRAVQELSHGMLRVNSADIMADIYDPNEPTAVTITEGAEEGTAVATLNLSELQGQISIRNQEGEFYQTDTVDDDGIEVMYQIADIDKDKPDGERDRYERENIDTWVENMNNPETHEALAYEALSVAAEQAVRPDVKASKDISEHLKDVAVNRLKTQLEELDPDTTYTVETTGTLPELTVAGLVQQNTEDNAELIVEEGAALPKFHEGASDIRTVGE